MGDERVTLVGRYELVRVIGSGGMGEVYEAIDRETDRRVAIKRLRAVALVEREDEVRFDREILATAQITSRHVVTVHDAGLDADGAPFMVMDYLVGEELGTLADRLGALDLDLAVRIASQACEGLIAAHAVGILHRDIKPSNLFLTAPTASGVRLVKILDFGIARIRHPGSLIAPVTELTRTGAIVGSPLYVAPEQLRGLKTIDERVDVWSLGVVLYRMLCGHVPHTGDSLGDVLVKVCSEPAPALRDRAPWIPAGLAAVVHRALEIEPAARTDSARALFAELTAWLPDGSAIDAARVHAHTGAVVAAPSRDPGSFGSAHVGASQASAAPRGVALASARMAAPPEVASAPVERRPAASAPVVPARRGVRTGYVLGLLAASGAAVGYLTWRLVTNRPTAAVANLPPVDALDLPGPLAASPAAQWFAAARPHCNAVEVTALVADTPPPAGDDGVAFTAACVALAGDIDQARHLLVGLPEPVRAYASAPMFAVAHPLADRHGHDPAIGDMMRVVIELWPDNYMAAYHAGMIEFQNGDPRAGDHLRHFQAIYRKADGFATTAQALLAALAAPDPDCTRIVATDPEGATIRAPGCR